MNCKTCQRGACAFAGTDDTERPKGCQAGYKSGPGKVNPPGHKMTEKAVLDDFVPPTDKEIAKAERQGAYLKRGRI